MRRLLLLMLVIIMSTWIVAPVAVAKGRFDGDWKVTMTTKEGPCPRYYVFPVTIRNGAIKGTVSGLKGLYDIKGRVAKDGSFSWGWSHSGGKLSDNEGTGLWASTAGVRGANCAGEIFLQREH
jgi:hypothetical protein